MNRPLYIMKLGGSVITDKGHPSGKLRFKRIKEIAKEIKRAQDKNDFDLILVNGTGSYGHPVAQKYNTANGIKNKTQLRGFCEIKYVVNLLTTKFNKLFLATGLNVFSCQTSSLIIQNRVKIFSFEIEPIKKLVHLGLIPMLSGDVTSDISWGGSICSGDAIAPYLAGELKATKLLFASDVDGIFDQDPHENKNAKLISVINKQNLPEFISSIGNSSHLDVTGGMRGKFLSIRKYSHKKTKTIIFNGLRKNSIFEALSGKEIGTLIDLA
ncbi:isopentenyl phosphate kinase family protein [Candidatus Microgenomates bacterium]|nr:isopentenyl phosphate kinase family protein [Candidatus Microgenomates bacterium]